ncbi:hypothetical protein ACIA5D_51025 [Actinoplanes sp. NPDC051513]|uniref:hypothetical protein n=1 Tax=Actinoplanes sp. NPDC051513 TaxID=3363908 RepID=UPI0037ADA326
MKYEDNLKAVGVYTSDDGYLSDENGESGNEGEIERVLSPSGKVLAIAQDPTGSRSGSHRDLFVPQGQPGPNSDFNPTSAGIAAYASWAKVKNVGEGDVLPRGAYPWGKTPTLSGKFPQLVSASASAEAGAVPAIALPDSTSIGYRNHQSASIGAVQIRGKRWYPARVVSITADVELEQKSIGVGSRWQVISASPQTGQSPGLNWISSDRYFEAEWLIGDRSAQNAANNSLFFAGILFGAAFGFGAAGFERLMASVFVAD